MQYFYCMLAGLLAGAVTGMFGAGGGMILVPLLSLLVKLDDNEIFPASVAVIAPICIVCLITNARPVPWQQALPYLLGSCIGGIRAGILGNRFPNLWLHRILGLFILWGGFRYLC